MLFRSGFRLIEVFQADLPDPRMQNMALLAAICRNNLLAGVRKEHYVAAMRDLMSGRMLEDNLSLFERLLLA